MEDKNATPSHPDPKVSSAATKEPTPGSPGGIPPGQHQSTPAPPTPTQNSALLENPYAPSWNPADNPPNQTRVSVKHEVPNQRSDPNDGRLPANPKDLPEPVNKGQVKNDPAYGGPQPATTHPPKPEDLPGPSPYGAPKSDSAKSEPFPSSTGSTSDRAK
jgi:hypothetical protein